MDEKNQMIRKVTKRYECRQEGSAGTIMTGILDACDHRKAEKHYIPWYVL
jgi:hypothetical protein